MKKLLPTCQVNNHHTDAKDQKWYRRLSYALIDDHPEHTRTYYRHTPPYDGRCFDDTNLHG